MAGRQVLKTRSFTCRYLGGYIAAAFFAVGAPAALCIGYLCDKMNRRNLLFAVVILGSWLSSLLYQMQWQCPRYASMHNKS